jgi:hypothetical protein
MFDYPHQTNKLIDASYSTIVAFFFSSAMGSKQETNFFTTHHTKRSVKHWLP